MARYITLSKAARLVGVKRGTLQKQIRAGELTTFEGMLDVNELLRAYPETQMEDNSMIERVERFMEQAFAKAMRAESEALDLHTLAKRVGLLSQELAAAKVEMNRGSRLLEQIKQQVAGLTGNGEISQFKSWFLQALEGKHESADYPEELLVKEAFLRIMAAHVRMLPSGHDFYVEGSADLLDAGLSAGLPLHYGCSDGSCGRCKGRLISGEVRQTREAKFEISDEARGKGEILLCCNTAVSDLVLEAPERKPGEAIAEQNISVAVRRAQQHGEAVTVFQLAMPKHTRLEFISGQYMRLQTIDGDAGEYSLASCPCDETKLELHVQRGTDVSSPLLLLKPGDMVKVQGPLGDFQLQPNSERPLVLVAMDVGFAPVKGLIEHALALDLVDSIQLYWLDTGATGHYLGNLCRSWSDALDTFEYHPLRSKGDPTQAAQRLVTALEKDGIDTQEADFFVVAYEEYLPVLQQALVDKGALADHVFVEPVRQGKPVQVPPAE